ncbi:MAG: aquaporin [Trueperaceae bacterium]|nr:aquaporin [Trueperaceae bacterium]MCO5172677.1 aquaporin [Trueperaceae bacterium]
MNIKPLVAEFVGTFTLIFAGVGAIAIGADLVGVALAHGIALAVMITAVAAVSGGHLNPAVTIGLWAAGKFPAGKILGYLVAQVAGAFVAAILIKLCLPAETAVAGTGTPALAPGVGVGAAILLEAVLTFFLVFTVLGTAVDKRAPKLGGFLIGLSVTMGILVAGPITGAALNPARHLGPALLAGGAFLGQFWLYWLGPVLGGIVAGAVYKTFIEAPEGKAN